MQENLDKYARERRGATVSVEVLLDWESDVHFRQQGTVNVRQFHAACFFFGL